MMEHRSPQVYEMTGTEWVVRRYFVFSQIREEDVARGHCRGQPWTVTANSVRLSGCWGKYHAICCRICSPKPLLLPKFQSRGRRRLCPDRLYFNLNISHLIPPDQSPLHLGDSLGVLFSQPMLNRGSKPVGRLLQPVQGFKAIVLPRSLTTEHSYKKGVQSEKLKAKIT